MDQQLINGDCLEVLDDMGRCDMIFADPPDNIGLGYNHYSDKRKDEHYLEWLSSCLSTFVSMADVVWFSFNAKWVSEVARKVWAIEQVWGVKARLCIQTFTFGQNCQTKLTNNYRPLYLIWGKDAEFYPDDIRVESWRQQHGDKRANPKGKVPSDVFDFPRVTGNSKQRRSWHPTQLHEGLVERCIRYTSQPGDVVVDPFGGTGTTMRVCDRIGRKSTLIELDETYCEKIAEDNGLVSDGDFFGYKRWQK